MILLMHVSVISQMFANQLQRRELSSTSHALVPAIACRDVHFQDVVVVVGLSREALVTRTAPELVVRERSPHLGRPLLQSRQCFRSQRALTVSRTNKVSGIAEGLLAP